MRVSTEEPSASGYDPGFLPGSHVDAPAPAEAAIESDIAPTKGGELVRKYTHFSLAMSATRRFCRWVAWNVDGGGLLPLSRVGLEFVLDPAYEEKYQVGDSLYSHNRLDRGHIARRADLLWGGADEAGRANLDSFFLTNITPQLDDFNQSRQHGLWGELENAIYDGVKVEDLRLSVFGGPIFKESDFPYKGILVPRSFWKVIAYVELGELKAAAYVLTQDDLESKVPSLGLEPFSVYQVSLGELSGMIKLTFASLMEADTMASGPNALAPQATRLIAARSQIVGP
jgi:endonuclease G, mitochondrial